jgi:hypothetical protein
MHAIEGTISRFSEGTNNALRCESLEPPMSQLGHWQTFRDAQATSAITPKDGVIGRQLVDS